jgi:hypothetical protein
MSKGTKIIIAVLVVIALAVGYIALNTPEQRTAGEKIGDAIDNLDEGFDDAARELEDRSPVEKMGDALEDATDGNAE